MDSRHPHRDPLTMWMLPTFSRCELDWVASDAHGRSGFFSTAGQGLVDARVAGWTEPDVEELSSRLAAMPVIRAARYHPLARFKHVEWFGIAERGFYAFDWDARDKRYALVAYPVEPLLAPHVLDPVLRRLLAGTTLDADFAASNEVTPPR